MFFLKKPLMAIYCWVAPCSTRATLGHSQLFVFQKTSDLKNVARVLRGVALDPPLQNSSHLTLTYCNILQRLKNKQHLTLLLLLPPVCVSTNGCVGGGGGWVVGFCIEEKVGKRFCCKFGFWSKRFC